MACYYLRPWWWVAPTQYVLVHHGSIGTCSFSGVKIRVNFIVKWAFRKAQRWLLYFLPYWILASLNVIKSGPKIMRAGIADDVGVSLFRLPNVSCRDTHPVRHIPQNTKDKNKVFWSGFRLSTSALLPCSALQPAWPPAPLSAESSVSAPVRHASVVLSSASTSSTAGRLTSSAAGRVVDKA